MNDKHIILVILISDVTASSDDHLDTTACRLFVVFLSNSGDLYSVARLCLYPVMSHESALLHNGIIIAATTALLQKDTANK